MQNEQCSRKRYKEMKEVKGSYAAAKIFTDQVEPYALAQLQMICDNEVSRGSVIRVMPDVHPGKVGTIGLTMTVGDRILPNLVGADIGCGVTAAVIKKQKVDGAKLDKVIRERIPFGFSVRSRAHRFFDRFDLNDLLCAHHINKEKAAASLGTLGGGNHFIEVDQDPNGRLYVVIHSGSRRLGQEVTEYYLREGQRKLKREGKEVPYELSYLEGDMMEGYLHDLQIVQRYAALNRETILDDLMKGMKWKEEERISCIHNYIEETEKCRILRKGAISARKGEKVLIPVNMKDGILLGMGKGNSDWNFSAPHGAGRRMNREMVKQHFTVSEFKKQMKGIYSTCVGKETLDEAPFAYRSLDDISRTIADTVEIQEVLAPIYNFKASGKD